MKYKFLCVLMCVTFALNFIKAQDFSPEPGLQASFMVPFAETPLDTLDFDITDDISGFYGGVCYIWSERPFFNGAGVYVRPGLEFSDGFRISDADLSAAVLFLRNLQLGMTWKAYGPEPNGENGFRDLNSSNLRFFVSLEAWSVISDLF